MRQSSGSLSEADAVTLRRRAMDLLARREHGREELGRKLVMRGAPPEDVESVLDQLERDGLLSDARFVEAYIRQLLSRGKGPLAIEHGLRERGVASGDAALAVESLDENWQQRACDVRARRFGRRAPAGEADRAKQARFLQSRGFTTAQVLRALEGSASAED